MTQTSILTVENLRVSYGGVCAVKEISFDVMPNEIVTLIGANGAGKSSVLRAISGVTGYSGVVSFQGTVLNRLSAHERAALGITHVPEGRGLFGNLTVLENLTLATWQRKDHKELEHDFRRVFELFPRLEQRKQQLAETLSGGEQQMLAVGRALMTKASFLLLDEPSMGLAPMLVRDIFAALSEINAQGVTILLVEQNANMALRIATRGYLLETGNVLFSGTAQELRGNEKVREAYLGGG